MKGFINNLNYTQTNTQKHLDTHKTKNTTNLLMYKHFLYYELVLYKTTPQSEQQVFYQTKYCSDNRNVSFYVKQKLKNLKVIFFF